MRTLVAFLLGLIIGGVAILFLPDPRRDELNAEIRAQTDALQAQLHQFGDQLKNSFSTQTGKISFPICDRDTLVVNTISCLPPPNLCAFASLREISLSSYTEQRS
jgi:hypothetical protein